MSRPLQSLDEAADLTHIYLSPHLDDAALSCGGAIARWAQMGARPLVVTLCSGLPGDLTEPPGGWPVGLEPAGMSARRAEDVAAMERLGTDWLWLDAWDAIYRHPALARDMDALFSKPPSPDSILETLRTALARVASRAPEATLHAPLGVGGHVDHRACCDAALAADGFAAVHFYEDLPYAERAPVVERLRSLGGSWAPVLTEITPFAVAKAGAIACYQSQIPMLFGGLKPMVARIFGYGSRIKPGGVFEREWRRGAVDRR